MLGGDDRDAPGRRSRSLPCRRRGLERPLLPRDPHPRLAPAAINGCVAQGAQLATFTCLEEWTNASNLGGSNFWLDAVHDGTQWKWGTGEPFVFTPPGSSFDPSTSPGTSACLVRDQHGEWVPVPCSSSSAGAYCERGPSQ